MSVRIADTKAEQYENEHTDEQNRKTKVTRQFWSGRYCAVHCKLLR